MSYTPLVTDGSGPSTVSTGTQSFAGAKTFSGGVQGPGSVPLGCMIVAMPSIDAVNSWQPPLSGAIKDGFMRADGTVINAGHVSQGCLLAAGTVLPNMIQKYPRGNTTSGTTGGSNTFTPAGTNATSNVPASGLSFSGSSTSYSVSVPAHYHGIGTGAALSAAGQTLGSTVISLASGSSSVSGNKNQLNHGHTTRTNNLNSGGGDRMLQFTTTGYTSAFSDTTYTHVNDVSLSGTFSASGSASGTIDISHTHAASTVTGTIGLVTGGQNGNLAFSASGSNTPSGSITGTATAAAQAFTGTAANSEPAYVEVIWVIRVK